MLRSDSSAVLELQTRIETSLLRIALSIAKPSVPIIATFAIKIWVVFLCIKRPLRLWHLGVVARHASDPLGRLVRSLKPFQTLTGRVNAFLQNLTILPQTVHLTGPSKAPCKHWRAAAAPPLQVLPEKLCR